MFMRTSGSCVSAGAWRCPADAGAATSKSSEKAVVWRDIIAAPQAMSGTALITFRADNQASDRQSGWLTTARRLRKVGDRTASPSTQGAELRRLSALKEASRSAARHSAGRKNDAALEPCRCATVLLIRHIAQRNEYDRGRSRSRCDLATDRRDGTRCASFFGVRRGPLQRSAARDASFARKPQSLRRARESALLLVISCEISRRARQRRSCCW